MMIQVEADVSNGMPSFEMVGVLSSEVREAKERIRAAIRNAGYLLPPKRITVNLCPADVRKSGAGFDLPIALAVLCAHGIVPPQKPGHTLFVGEITLNGALRPVRGVLPMALAARQAGIRAFVLPVENAREAAFVKELAVYPAADLSSVIKHLNGQTLPEFTTINIEETASDLSADVDFSQISGQYTLRRA